MNDNRFNRQNDDYDNFKYNVNNQFDNEFVSPNFGEEQKEVVTNFVANNGESSVAKVSFIIGLISIGALVSFMIPLPVVIAPYAVICGIVSLVIKPKVDTSKAILGIVFGSVSFILSFLAYIIIILFI